MGVATEEPSQSIISKSTEGQLKPTQKKTPQRKKKRVWERTRWKDILINHTNGESAVNKIESTKNERNLEVNLDVSSIVGPELEQKKKNSVTEAKGGEPNLGNLDLIKQQDTIVEVNPDLVGKQGIVNVVGRKRKRKRNKGKTKMISNIILVEQNETDAQAVISLSEQTSLIQESLRGNDEKSSPEIAKIGVPNAGNIYITKQQDASSEINPDLTGTQGVNNMVGKKKKKKKNKGKTRVTQDTSFVQHIENDGSPSEKPRLNEESLRGNDEKSSPEIAVEIKQKNSDNEAKIGVPNVGNIDITMQQDASSEISLDLTGTQGVNNTVGKKQKKKKNKGKMRVTQDTSLVKEIENDGSLSEKPSLNEESLRGNDEKSSPEIAGKKVENKQKNSEEAKSGVSNLGNIDTIQRQEANSEINPDLAGTQGVNNNDGKKQKRKKNKGKTRVMQNTILVKEIENDDEAVASQSDKPSLNEELFRCNSEKYVPEIAGIELKSKREKSVIKEGSGVPNLGNMDVMNRQDANAEVNPDLPGTQGLDNGVGRKGKGKRNKGKMKVVPNTLVEQNEMDVKAAASQSQNDDIFRCSEETSGLAIAGTGLESKRKTKPQSKVPNLGNIDLIKQQDANGEVKSDLAGSQDVNNEVGRKGKGKRSKGLMIDSATEEKIEVPILGNIDQLKGEDVNAEVNLGLAGTQGVSNEIERKGKRKRNKDEKSKSMTACVDPESADKENGKPKEATEIREHIAGTSSTKDVSAVQKDNESIAMMEEVSSSVAISGGTSEITAPGVACGKSKALEENPLSVEACPCHSRRKLLVLDLNGILADVLEHREIKHKEFIPDAKLHGKSVFKRPYTDDFLRFCFERFDVCIWSSRFRGNVNKMIDILMGDEQQRVMLRWSQSECTRTKFKTLENKHKPLVMKELTKLWDHFGHCSCGKRKYDESNTLLVDDSPYKALRNPPHTGIFPNPYEYFRSEDSALGPQGDLRLYLEKLANAGNVQEFVKENPLGQPFITESHASWDFYSQIRGDDT